MYAGYSLVVGPENEVYFGIATGVKAGYKVVVSRWRKHRLVFEPYASASVSLRNFVRYYTDPELLRHPMITAGVRLVFERHARPPAPDTIHVKEV